MGPSFCVLGCDIALGFASGYITSSDTKLGSHISHIDLLVYYILYIRTSHQLQVCYPIADLCTGLLQYNRIAEVSALIADLKSVSAAASSDTAVHSLPSFPLQIMEMHKRKNKVV